jgi:hypothetical protein
MPCEPAPAAPALGEPAALPLLPADDPPEPCAREATGDVSIAIAAMAAVAVASFIENLLWGATTGALGLFLPEPISGRIIDPLPLDARSDGACANLSPSTMTRSIS